MCADVLMFWVEASVEECMIWIEINRGEVGERESNIDSKAKGQGKQTSKQDYEYAHGLIGLQD